MTVIWWLRRDIRLTDNPALQTALEYGLVVPVFILDPHLLDRTPLRRQHFLFSGLSELDQGLRALGSKLLIRSGEPLGVLRKLLAESGAQAIVAEEDYTPYATHRDGRIAAELPLRLVQGQTVNHPAAVRKPDGDPYTVFTPYSKVWKAILPDIKPIPIPDHLPTVPDLASQPLPDYETSNLFPSGESEAQQRLSEFSKIAIDRYANDRNRMDLDGTSALSPYIRFGMLSMRQAAAATLSAIQTAVDSSARKGAETWLNELIWREFYISILFHFPHVARTSFNPAYADIRWRTDQADFSAWKDGQTGYPVVDAAMRQLKETGWMHNRARMIVASFLVKDLLINWQWGERWFMDNLLDGDLAANNGGWQWTAGTGTDAAPYFRIFNPVLQSKKFDPHGNYIRRWVPELRDVPEQHIHAPWEKPELARVRIGKDYPAPVIDHRFARERTLQAYRQAK